MAAKRKLPVLHPMLERRPVTRGDCADGIRPCFYISCRHNLLVDVLDDGSVVINAKYHRPDGAARVISPNARSEERFRDEADDAVEAWVDDPENPPPSCVLDEVDSDKRTRHVEEARIKGGFELDFIADVLYVSRERVRQVEAEALENLRHKFKRLGIDFNDVLEGWGLTGGQE